VIRDLDELGDCAIDVSASQIEIAERVDGVPIARMFFDQPPVLGDCQIDPAFALQLLCLA